MKPHFLLATMSLALSAPASLGATELESLRAMCAEQERQIRHLEEENRQLRSLHGEVVRQSAHTVPVSAPLPSAAAAAAASAASYVVKPGDTLSKIASKHGVSVTALARANSIKDPAKLSVGHKLTIPGGTATPAPAPIPAAAASSGGSPKTEGHKVQKGETFYSIAKQHGVSTQALIAANPQTKPTALRLGQILQVPGAAAPHKEMPATAGTGRESRKPETAAPNREERTAARNQPANRPAAPAPASSQQQVAVQQPAPAPKPEAPAKKEFRPIAIEKEMTYGEFAALHGTDVERLNDFNGLDLTTSAVLAKGSELYVPAQP